MKQRNFGAPALAAAILISLLSACGGGGGEGGGGADVSLPSGITIFPAGGAVDVDLSPAITVTFPGDVDETTVTSSAFTLSGPKGAIEGSITYDVATKTATFIPAARLASTADYTATVTTAVMTKGSSVLASDYSWTFTTRARKWGTPQLIESNDETNFESAKTAINDRGDVVAIWTPMMTGSYFHLWANTYTMKGGWGTPTLIVNDADVEYSEVGIDNEGNAIVMWQASYVSPADASKMAIYASRYTQAGGWESVQRIDTNTGNAEQPDFAMSVSGYATATWKQNSDILANRYTPAAGWGTPQIVDEERDNAYNPSVAMDAAGDAMVVWEQHSEGYQSIWSRLYMAGRGWEAAQTIDDTTDTRHPYVAMSRDGHAVAVWTQYDSVGPSSAANRYVPGEGWKEPQIINFGSRAFRDYRSAINDDGRIVTIWLDSGTSGTQVNFNDFTPDGDWGATDHIAGGDGTLIGATPQVVADSYGNFMLAWSQGDATSHHAYVSSLSADGTWGEPQAIEAAGSLADVGDLAMNSSGDAAAALIAYDGATLNVAVNLYQ